MGGAGAGGASGGGAGPTCTGSGICGRASDGIYCARSNGSSALVSFERWTSGYSDASGWSPPNQYWATIQFPDLNGDGRSDVCGRAANGLVCALATGSGAFSMPTLWLAQFGDDGGWNVLPAYWATLRFADVNGDGFADVCARGASGISCAISNGADAFAPATSWTAAFDDGAGWHLHQSYWGTIEYPDINADGRADVCGRSAAGIACGLSSGSSFDAVTVWQGSFSDAASWSSSPSYWKTIQFPDVNGDGAADVCGRGSEGVLCGFSNGANGFGPLAVWEPNFSDGNFWNSSSAYYQTIQFPDVDGDGQADVCARGFLGIYCSLSTGLRFRDLALWGAAYSDANGYAANETLWGTLQYPDLDADGRADVCGRSQSGVVCGLSNGQIFGTSLWSDHFSDAEGWQSRQSYGLTVQSPNQNVPGCERVTKPSSYRTSVQRLGPL